MMCTCYDTSLGGWAAYLYLAVRVTVVIYNFLSFVGWLRESLSHEGEKENGM